MNTLYPTRELGSALFAANVADADIEKVKTDPRGFIFNNNDNAPTDVSVVENTDSVMNLALPFYTDMNRRPPNVVNDTDMEDASGGHWSHGYSDGRRYDEYDPRSPNFIGWEYIGQY